ncbi:hypothetical protein [Actinobacillus porcinus]|uniref:hypothetical protein n=1 Tax=Actinobacillus porcinus TaxID=51048 RepID=UPI002A91F247|nr:hypothetical protein [Actinobacillus porcinus]MDY5847585.1 hypothetical protein [Actinobacillus porcinus]
MNTTELLAQRENTHGDFHQNKHITNISSEEKRKLYLAYKNMKLRCYDKNRDCYHNYGGRGITVCEEWLSSRNSFVEWAINNGHSMNLSLDRINNDLGYSPNNCRWVDMKTQLRNQRRNTLILFNGKLKTLSEHAEDIGIKPDTLRKRIKERNIPLEMAMVAGRLNASKLIHGTRIGYEKGCKCDECRAANAARAKKYRLNRKLKTGK